MASLPEVEYIEKPKRLFFEVENGRRVSCIDAVQGARFALSGQGVLIGILDSGLDYANPDFLLRRGRPGSGLSGIRRKTGNIQKRRSTGPWRRKTRLRENRSVSSEDTSGHGTAVAGIAAGNGRGSGGRYAGVAPESPLVIVKLARARAGGFPRTTELMRGLDYVIRKAQEYQNPIAVNISFGNTYGSHDGTSLLERFIDDLANIWKSVICIGTGNEAAGAGHTAGVLKEGENTVIRLAVQERQAGFGIQIWKEYTDETEIALVSPSGVRVGPVQAILGPQRFTVEDTEVLLYYGEPSPYSTAQEIYMELLPKSSWVDDGVWQIVLTPGRILSGAYELWLPGEEILNRETGFLSPVSRTTLTIPSTSFRAVSVRGI